MRPQLQRQQRRGSSGSSGTARLAGTLMAFFGGGGQEEEEAAPLLSSSARRDRNRPAKGQAGKKRLRAHHSERFDYLIVFPGDVEGERQPAGTVRSARRAPPPPHTHTAPTAALPPSLDPTALRCRRSSPPISSHPIPSPESSGGEWVNGKFQRSSVRPRRISFEDAVRTYKHASTGGDESKARAETRWVRVRNARGSRRAAFDVRGARARPALSVAARSVETCGARGSPALRPVTLAPPAPSLLSGSPRRGWRSFARARRTSTTRCRTARSR